MLMKNKKLDVNDCNLITNFTTYKKREAERYKIIVI